MNQIGLIEDGAVLIVDGRIAAVGPTRRIENLAESRGARVMGAEGRVVMPGFIDCHAFPASVPPLFQRIEADGAESCAGSLLRGASGVLAGARVALEAQKVLRSCVRHGTTLIGAHSGLAADETGEFRTLRAYRKLDRRPIDVLTAFLPRPRQPGESPAERMEYLRHVRTQLLPRIQHLRLARFAAFDCDGLPAGTVEDAREYLNHARALGFSSKLLCDRSAPTGAARLTLEFEAASVACLNAIVPDDIAALALSNTVAVLLPGLAYHQGEPFAPARKLIDEGVPVALASGFDHQSSPSFNMQTIIAMACRLLGMTPAEAITAATINAACALRADHDRGSLEYGKRADLIVLNAGDYRALPHYLGVNLVAMAMKDGEVVSKQSEVRAPDTGVRTPVSAA